MRIGTALLLVCALLGCSARETVNQALPNTPLAREKIRIEPTQRPSPGRGRTFLHLDDISKQYGIVPLRTSEMTGDEYELRLWSTIGLGIERCFILKRKNNLWNAVVVTPILTDGESAESTKGKLRVLKNKLGRGSLEPDQLNQFVTAENLIPPFAHELDSPSGLPVMDEGLIAIEVRKGDSYDVVSYRAFSESKDANKIFQVCRQFEKWFEVTIGCAH